jgi:hypothetical protein
MKQALGSLPSTYIVMVPRARFGMDLRSLLSLSAFGERCRRPLRNLDLRGRAEEKAVQQRPERIWHSLGATGRFFGNSAFEVCPPKPRSHSRFAASAVGGRVCRRPGCRRTVIVELKCVDHVANERIAQCINYLKASRLHAALLINFHRPKLEWKRILLD